MTKSIKNFIFLALGSMFVFVLTACNPEPGDEDSEVNHTDEIVTIKVLYPWGEDAFEERYKAIDEKLENIKLELVDSQAQLEPLQELNAKKIIPDVILANWGIEPLKQLDMVQPIDQLIKKHQFDLDTLFPSAVANARSFDSEGQMLGMPVGGGGYALYYNKEVFDLFGESYPSDDMTWNEVVELARELTVEKGGTQYRGLEMGSVPSASFDTLVPLLEFGVNLTDPETGEVRITKDSMKVRTKYSALRNEFSHNKSMLKLMDLEQVFSLKNDFSRRHSCPNPPPPALTGGRLSKFVDWYLWLLN